MSKRPQRRSILLAEVSTIKDKKETTSPISPKKNTRTLLSRGVKSRYNLCYNPVLANRNRRQLVAEPGFVTPRETSVSFAESKKPIKKFIIFPTGKPRTVRLKKTKPTQHIDTTQAHKSKVMPIEIKYNKETFAESNSSEETPKFKQEDNSVACEELSKSSFTSAFNTVQNLQKTQGNDSNHPIPMVNFRRARLLKASNKQNQKALPNKETPETHITTNKRVQVPSTSIRTERNSKKSFNTANFPWNKDTIDPCNLTFGED